MTSRRVITDRDRLCFRCPIPGGCDESDPRCLWRQASSSDRRWGGNGKRILEVLGEEGPLTYAEIWRRLGGSRKAVTNALQKLRKKGLVLLCENEWHYEKQN